MSTHILKQDLPNYPKYSRITIPDEESSILLKGKGYFIQIYRDSELLMIDYPDLFYSIHNDPKNINPIREKNESFKIKDFENGIYMRHTPGYNGTNSVTYEQLIKNTDVIPIYLYHESNIVCGEVIYKYLLSGDKVLGVATANVNFITDDGEFSRFVSIEEKETIAGNYRKSTNYARGQKGYYQKLSDKDLTEDTLDLIKHACKAHSTSGYDLTFDKESKRIIREYKH